MRTKRSNRDSDRRAEGQALRIDKLLWFLRFARNRAMAQKLANKGYVRLNGRRVDRAHLMVRKGDILTIPKDRDVHVIRIAKLPVRRTSAPDAQSCFERLTPGD